MPASRRPLVRAAVTATAVVALLTALAACRPEPAPSPTSTGSAAPTASPDPSATPAPSRSGDALSLPATCDEVYTPEMLATLTADVAPLNDPGTTMVSTENVTGLEVLGSGAPTIRCTWGPPSERGIATNVTLVTGDQTEALGSAFAESGYAVTEFDDGTLYEIEQQTITQDDEIVTLGESHFLRAGVWVSTRWINVNPDGYTQAVVEAVWS